MKETFFFLKISCLFFFSIFFFVVKRNQTVVNAELIRKNNKCQKTLKINYIQTWFAGLQCNLSVPNK